MTAAIQLICTVLSLIPAIITAIKAIEEAVPGTGEGEKKIAAMRAIIEQVSDQANLIWPAVEKVITILVNLFNQTGVFIKKPQ